MSERLRYLQRQKSLLCEHLAWIETEIARETVSVEPQLTQPQTPPPRPESTPTDALCPDALLERYAETERLQHTDIRKGCLRIFASTLALIFFGILAIWWLRYR